MAAFSAKSGSVKDAQAVCCDCYNHPSSSRGKWDSSSLCNRHFNNFKWKQQAGTMCGVHSRRITGVNKIHWDYVYLCRAANNRQHTQWCSPSQVQMLLSWQGGGNSWLDVTSCSSYLKFCPYIPPSWSHHRCAACGHGCKTSCSLGMYFVSWHSSREGVAGKGELSRQQVSSGLSCWAEIRGAAPFSVPCPPNLLCVRLNFKAAPLPQSYSGRSVSFAVCEQRKMVFKWYSNGEVLKHWASIFTDVWEPCLQRNRGQSRTKMTFKNLTLLSMQLPKYLA